MADEVKRKTDRPAKLKKTPLQLVISSDPNAVVSSQSQPIGTPPPVSLRKCRSDDPTSASIVEGDQPFPALVGSLSSSSSSSSAPASSSTFFPQISVEKCPEDMGGGGDGCHRDVSQDEKERRTKTMTKTMSSDDGLTPPQRFLTRDGDGIVFELSHGLKQHVDATAAAAAAADKQVTGQGGRPT